MTAGWITSLRTNPRNRDRAIAAGWLMIGLVLLLLGATRLWGAIAPFPANPAIFATLLVAMALVSTQRSAHPILALGAGTIIAITDLLFGGSLGVVIIASDLVYAAVKNSSERAVRNLRWTILGFGGLAAAAIVLVYPSNPPAQAVTAQWAAVIIISALWGWNVRSEGHRTQTMMAAQHAEALHHLRQTTAHDLHDLVANQIAVAGLHIEAAKLQLEFAGPIPAAAEHSLDQATRGTANAGRQLRQLIRLLTAVDAFTQVDDRPLPHLIDETINEVDARLPSARTLRWDGGSRDGLRDQLTTMRDPDARILIRVFHELITNAVKHGTGDIHVTVATHPSLSVTVTNQVAPSDTTQRGTGIGIAAATLLLNGTAITLDSSADATTTGWKSTLSMPMGAQLL